MPKITHPNRTRQHQYIEPSPSCSPRASSRRWVTSWYFVLQDFQLVSSFVGTSSPPWLASEGLGDPEHPRATDDGWLLNRLKRREAVCCFLIFVWFWSCLFFCFCLGLSWTDLFWWCSWGWEVGMFGWFIDVYCIVHLVGSLVSVGRFMGLLTTSWDHARSEKCRLDWSMWSVG